MILLAFSYRRGFQTVIGEVALDAAVHEQHQVAAQVTEHQVEVGANIADHVRPLPRRLTIDGYVSNAPISLPLTQNRGVRAFDARMTVQTPTGRSVDVSALQFDGPLDRARDVYGDLVDAALAGALFTITTSLAQYQNFAIVNFQVPRDAGIGDSLHFQIDFQEVRLVEAQTVKGLPPRQKALRKPDHKGEKPPQAAEEDRRTALAKINDWLER